MVYFTHKCRSIYHTLILCIWYCSRHFRAPQNSASVLSWCKVPQKYASMKVPFGTLWMAMRIHEMISTDSDDCNEQRIQATNMHDPSVSKHPTYNAWWKKNIQPLPCLCDQLDLSIFASWVWAHWCWQLQPFWGSLQRRRFSKLWLLQPSRLSGAILLSYGVYMCI